MGAKDARPQAGERAVAVALCSAATWAAYVERTGFAVAFTSVAQASGLDQGAKGDVLSAFYWGYALTQIPGGWLSGKLGGVPVLLASYAAWGLASAATPAAARGGGSWNLGLWVARAVVGACQGVIFPSIHTILAAWSPPQERSRSVSVAMSGMYVGSATAMLLAPAVVEQAGPRAELVMCGVLAWLWVALWVAAAPRYPTAAAAVAREGSGLPPPAGASAPLPSPASASSVPWGALLSSAAVWSIILNNFTFHYAFYVLVNWLPSYFEQALHAPLARNKVASMAPYAAMAVCTTAGGVWSDWLISRGVPVGRSRKVVNTAGFVLTAWALMTVALTSDAGTASMLTTVALAGAATARGGFAVNHLDIAPGRAGVLMGLSNTAGTIAGVIGVRATGALLDANGGNWAVVFQVPALLCLVAAGAFIAFAKGEKIFS